MEFRDSELIRKLVRQGLSQDRVGARKLARMMRGKGLAADAGLNVASAQNGEGGDHGELVLISTGGRAHAHSQAPAGARRPLLIVIDGGKR